MQSIMIMSATTRGITACRSVVYPIKKTGILTLQDKPTKYLRWIQVIQKVFSIPGNKIWQAEEARELQRQYSIDFEKYDPDQTVSIFIATPKNG